MRLFASCVILHAAGATALADDVFLANGGRISGVVRQEHPVVVIEVAGGTVGIPHSQVIAIERKRHLIHQYYDRRQELGPSPAAEELYVLATWAQEMRLGRFARQVAQEALGIDAEHRGARQLLGHVQRDGRWLTPEQARAADGEVWFRGRWRPIAERDRILASERAARSELRARRPAVSSEPTFMMVEVMRFGIEPLKTER
jgi:hypothetical protein